MTVKGIGKPITVGIDLGGDGLRVAADRDGSPSIVPVRSTSARLPRVVRFHDGQNVDTSGYRVLSLKRIMDFDEVVRSQIGEINTLEYVTHLFKSVLDDGAFKSVPGGLHVLGAIPPCFSQRQRSALRTALTEAGFTSAKLLDDSLAALLGSWDLVQRKNTILVYSWGASTFCASLYRPSGAGMFKPVIAPEGDRTLGGDDINSALLDYLYKVLSTRWQGDLRVRSQPVFYELERAKLALARNGRGYVSLSNLGLQNQTSEAEGDEVEIPRGIFDDAVIAMLDRTFSLVDRVLTGGKCDKPDAVLLVGGSTAIPEVRRRLEERFPGRLAEAVENAVALGSVVYGRMLPPQEWEAAERRQESPVHPHPAVEAQTHAAPPRRQEQASAMASASSGAGSWAETLDVSPLLDMAEAYHGRGFLAEALEKLELAHSRLGEFTSVVYLKAAADLLSKGSFGRAFPLLQKANRLHPANRDVAWQYAEMCIKYSDQLLKRRNYRDAWGYAYEAVKAVEGIPNAARDYPFQLAACLYREACILNALGRATEVEQLLVRCVKLDPEKSLYLEELDRLRGARRRTLFVPRGGAAPKSEKVGRNDPCPCGSGEKFKHCCLSKQR